MSPSNSKTISDQAEGLLRHPRHELCPIRVRETLRLSPLIRCRPLPYLVASATAWLAATSVAAPFASITFPAFTLALVRAHERGSRDRSRGTSRDWVVTHAPAAHVETVTWRASVRSVCPITTRPVAVHTNRLAVPRGHVERARGVQLVLPLPVGRCRLGSGLLSS